MRGTENTHPLRKNEIHPSTVLFAWSAPAKVVVIAVNAKSAKLSRKRCLLIVNLRHDQRVGGAKSHYRCP